MPLSPGDRAGDAPVAEGEPGVRAGGAAGEVAFEVADGGAVPVIGLPGAGGFGGVRVLAGGPVRPGADAGGAAAGLSVAVTAASLVMQAMAVSGSRVRCALR
ncbi:MAG TPA: hypothetical protein VGI96_46645 [Streptosporangiaceae bacterium]|jgi:hypothetical protein